jgi:hypothetical protein
MEEEIELRGKYIFKKILVKNYLALFKVLTKTSKFLKIEKIIL